MHLANLPASRLFLALPGVRGFWLAACVGGFIAGAGCAIADASGVEAPSGSIPFDIPSESLTSALEAYARISGREVLYDGTLATGHRSSKVEGVYAPAAALRMLLLGTGLSAQFKDTDFFVLVPTPPVERQAGAEGGTRSAILLRYYGRLQASLRAAFCEDDAALPGRYRVAARLWIGPSGDVLRETRLASTGNARLDREIDKTLRSLRLDDPPPAGAAQPFTIVVMPSAPGVSPGCDDDDARPLHAQAGP
jgi:hypothetical protein